MSSHPLSSLLVSRRVLGVRVRLRMKTGISRNKTDRNTDPNIIKGKPPRSIPRRFLVDDLYLDYSSAKYLMVRTIWLV